VKTKLAVLGIGVGMLAAVTPVRAHHSFAGTYLEDAPPVRVEGTLKEFLLRNPHSFVQVEDDKLKNADGTPVRWSIEWAAAGQLAQQGVSATSLKVGDHVVVMGSPGRNPADHRLRYRSLESSNGFKNGASFN
jgi:Family of unknown function (DUF6152)